MNIFSKRSTITLDAFTPSEGMKMLNPIAPVREFYPKWLKELKPTGKTLHKEGGSIKSLFPDDGAEVEFSTIKKCPSMKELYNTGFIIPLWSDVVIRTTSRGIEDVFYSYKDSPAPNFHSKEQLGPAFNNFLHIKINTPWIIKEKTGANFYFGSPFWNNIDFIESMFFTPGIINYKYQVDVNINYFLPKAEKQIKISSGTPLVHLIPLTEKNVEVKCHCVTKEEYEKLQEPYHYGLASSFHGRYENLKKRMIEKSGKCPFS